MTPSVSSEPNSDASSIEHSDLWPFSHQTSWVLMVYVAFWLGALFGVWLKGA